MKPLVAALAVVGSLLASQANAANYTFDFEGAGESFLGSVTTTTSGTAQLITSLSGTLNGTAVSLAAPGIIPDTPTNDNLIFPAKTGTGLQSGTTGYIDSGGIGFTQGSTLYNLYYNTSSTTTGYELANYTTELNISAGNLTLTPSAVSAAPEPGAWALMMAGVGAMGLMLRRRRQPKLARVAV